MDDERSRMTTDDERRRLSELAAWVASDPDPDRAARCGACGTVVGGWYEVPGEGWFVYTPDEADMVAFHELLSCPGCAARLIIPRFRPSRPSGRNAKLRPFKP